MARVGLWVISLIAWLVLALNVQAQTGFQPTVTMLGLSAQTENGESIQWVISLSNTGTITGETIRLEHVVGTGLRVDRVEIGDGTIHVDDRTVVVELPSLAPNETLQFSIFTQVIASEGLSSTACVSATNLSETSCTTGLPVSSLPNTGEVPFWRRSLLWLAMLAVSTSSVLIGIGLQGLQSLRH